jgi:hypothetical protein
MITESTVQQLSAELNKSGKTFAEFLAELFKDKFVEIYLGDAYETISTEQISTDYAAVFCGKVVGAYKECLIISAAYIDINQKMRLGKLVFISERAIRALSPVGESGIMQDLFMKSNEVASLYRALRKSNEIV